MKLKNYPALLASLGLFSSLLQFSSCNKAEPFPEQIEFEAPKSFELKFGTDTLIDFSKQLVKYKSINVQLDFKDNPDLLVNTSYRLQQLLAKAITFDHKTLKLHINSSLLYPNGGKNHSRDISIPENFSVKMTLNTFSGTLPAQQQFTFKVLPLDLAIKGATKDHNHQFSYALYSAEETAFPLEAAEWLNQGAFWHLPEPHDKQVSLKDNKIVFAGTEGNLTNQEEKTYNVAPELLKDDFPIAKLQFRSIFIPKIQFVFGTYYPEYNFSVKYNYLIVNLNEGYTSQAPSLYPEKYKSKFELVKIEKDGQAFSDSDKIFSINTENGVVSSKEKNNLKPGSYKLTVKAITSTGIALETTLTLVLEK